MNPSIKLVILVTLSIVVVTQAEKTVPCGTTEQLLDEKTGILVLDDSLVKAGSTCKWSCIDSGLLLFIRAINLANDDKLVVYSQHEEKARASFNLHDSGVIPLDKGNWSIEVEFGPSEQARYINIGYTKDRLLYLTGPQVETLVVHTIGIPTKQLFDINIRQQTNSSTLLKLGQINAKVTPSKNNPVNGYTLIDSDSFNITIDSVSETSTIHAWDVLTSCSSYNLDPKSTPFSLDVDRGLPHYKCVQLMALSKPEGYFEVDFREFKNVISREDKFTILPSDNDSLVINNRVASLYENTIQSFKGTGLVILYESPSSMNPLVLELNQIITSASFVGGPQGAGKIIKPTGKASLVRYFYNGEPYPSISLKAPLPPTVSMDIFDRNNKTLLTFNANEALPPLITMGLKKTMIVQFKSDGEAIMKLPDYEFQIQQNQYNKTSYENFDSLAITNMTQTHSIWVIATKDQSEKFIILSLDYFNFTNQQDCAKVFKLSLDAGKEEEVARFCGNSQQMLPIKLLLDKRFKHYVMLTKDAKTPSLSFYASYSYIMPRDQRAVVVPIESNNMTLTTIGYPSSYPVGSSNQTYILKSSRNVVLTSFKDVDIRSGDQLILSYGNTTVNYIGNKNYTLIGDVMTHGTPAISLIQTRKKLNGTLSHSKGYKVDVQTFDYGMRLTNESATSIPIVPNTVIIISSRDSKKHKRIVFNTTAEPLIYDSSVVGKHLLNGHNGTSTSNTVIMIYQSNASLSYQWKDCDDKVGDILCDNATRCVPKNLQCNGIPDCDDMGDELSRCSNNAPHPDPQVKEVGVGGMTIFTLIIFTLIIGFVAGKFGQDAYRYAEARFRSGDYTAFASSE